MGCRCISPVEAVARRAVGKFVHLEPLNCELACKPWLLVFFACWCVVIKRLVAEKAENVAAHVVDIRNDGQSSITTQPTNDHRVSACIYAQTHKLQTCARHWCFIYGLRVSDADATNAGTPQFFLAIAHDNVRGIYDLCTALSRSTSTLEREGKRKRNSEALLYAAVPHLAAFGSRTGALRWILHPLKGFP